jgi:hypothetical protein
MTAEGAPTTATAQQAPSRWRWLLWAVLVALVALGLNWASSTTRLFQPGTVEEFWQHASDGMVYPPREHWFVYYDQGFHGQFFYRVERRTVEDSTRAAVATLGAERASLKRFNYTRELDTWLALDPAQRTPDELVSLVRAGTAARLRSRDPSIYEYHLASEQRFEVLWREDEFFPEREALELAFFTVVVTFALWPWLRARSALRYFLHVSVTPPLLFLPYWLGYASLTFTSAGPSGGALYPLAIFWAGLSLRRFFTPLDEWFFRTVPPLLAPLSQSRGEMISLTGGAVGPVAVLVAGYLVGSIVWAIVWSRTRWRRSPS